MSFYLCPLFQGVVQFTDDVSEPLANGQIFTYQAGTTTPVVTATSKAGTANNPNPILLDSTGRLTQEIWLTGGVSYKFIVTDSQGVQVGPTYDNVQGVNDITGIFQPVNVINAINSVDTSNAASANAARWAYEEGNAAFTRANAAFTLANSAYAAANVSGIQVYDSGVFVYSAKGLNFQNTAGINVSTTANNTLVDIQITANGQNQNTSANGYTTLPGGVILTWGQFAAGGGDTAVTFNTPFPNACWVVVPGQASSTGTEFWTVRQGTVSKNGFTMYNNNSGTINYIAIGN